MPFPVWLRRFDKLSFDTIKAVNPNVLEYWGFLVCYWQDRAFHFFVYHWPTSHKTFPNLIIISTSINKGTNILNCKIFLNFLEDHGGVLCEDLKTLRFKNCNCSIFSLSYMSSISGVSALDSFTIPFWVQITNELGLFMLAPIYSHNGSELNLTQE